MYAKIALLLKKNIRFAHYFVSRGHNGKFSYIG